LIIAAGTIVYEIEKNRIQNEFAEVLKNYYSNSQNTQGVFIEYISVPTTYGGGVTYKKYYNARNGSLLGEQRFLW
jgi:hypothetical protein